MRIMKAFKYTVPLSVYVLVFFAFKATGIVAWLPALYAFGFIPLVELLAKPNAINMDKAEEEIIKHDKIYDYLLYAALLCIFPSVVWFLYNIKNDVAAFANGQNKLAIGFAIAGKIYSLGVVLGTMGINIAHELGHRVNKFEQFLAKLGLMPSFYMHFFTEHNKGHHKHVATPNDPASARFNENLYKFWIRTVVGSYKSAWKIANDECSKKGKSKYGFANEMVVFSLVQLLFLGTVLYFYGIVVTTLFLLASIIGFLLLETVNYIEHYGLVRKEISEGKFERALPQHSWNSNHVFGRVFLFELTRHSDHHYLASRKYQILRHHDEAPQMPTGYPGMMVLSTIPPLWFKIMNPKVEALRK
jgi:alkane 1-monooxygenase